MMKVERYRVNNMQYPIPGTNFGTKPKEDERKFFTLEKADKDEDLDEAVKQRRMDLVQKLIKG